MPKPTFFNLSEEKRKRIFNAAVKEFASRRFSEASINKIVKEAKIPWGSYYQYFDDKEDLYRYVYTEILRKKRDIVYNTEIVDLNSDVFEICIQSVKASYEWGKANPEYNNVGLLMDIDFSDIAVELRTMANESLRKLIDRDKQRGLIRPETDTDLVTDMIATLIVKEYFKTGHNKDLYLKKVNEIINIIKGGICQC
jgi:AcrR family transcriptional regulator